MNRKLQKTIRVLIIPLLLIIVLPSASAVNYEPGVEVGDEYIWAVERNIYNVSQQEIRKWYYVNNISAIFDNGTDTILQGWEAELLLVSLPEDNSDIVENLTIFTDYQAHPENLIETRFLPEGTKIGDYADLLQTEVPDVTSAQSQNDGWGIDLNISGTLYSTKYNENGVMDVYSSHAQTGSILDGFSNYTARLYSINGEMYSPEEASGLNNIPGYSNLPLMVGLGICSFLIFSHIRRKVKQ